jgi:hypothetical protein
MLAVDADCLRRFEHEARAAAALAHPGILAVYNVGVCETAPFIVMELLEGASLRDRLRTERLSARNAVGYASQIADALAAAHEKGILFLLSPAVAAAQELEPGAYSPIPKGFNIVMVIAGVNWGDVAFEPSLPVDNANATIRTTAVAFTRAFSVDLPAPSASPVDRPTQRL